MAAEPCNLSDSFDVLWENFVIWYWRLQLGTPDTFHLVMQMRILVRLHRRSLMPLLWRLIRFVAFPLLNDLLFFGLFLSLHFTRTTAGENHIVQLVPWLITTSGSMDAVRRINLLCRRPFRLDVTNRRRWPSRIIPRWRSVKEQRIRRFLQSTHRILYVSTYIEAASLPRRTLRWEHGTADPVQLDDLISRDVIKAWPVALSWCRHKAAAHTWDLVGLIFNIYLVIYIGCLEVRHNRKRPTKSPC